MEVVIDQSYDVGTPIKRGDFLLLVVSSGPARKPVPKLSEMSLQAAQKQLTKISLEALVVSEVINPAPKGTVLAQEPAEGTIVDAGSIVQLSVSLGQALVPELSGQIWTEATDNLKKAKLQAGKVDYIEIEDTNQQGRVASQLPVAGEMVAEGSLVDLVVYTSTQTAVPSASPTAGGAQ